MAGDVLGIATSGLLAFQQALSTTSHNIANANTLGYSKQRVDFTSQVPQQSGAGFIGQGVLTDTVRRHYDEFLTREVRASTSATLDLQTFHREAGRIADLLGDSQAGLGVGMDNFFNAVQDLSNDPASVPLRQVVMSEAESLASRFQYLDQQLAGTRANVTSQLQGAVADINTLSTSIAAMNESITQAIGQGAGNMPNDLLDQRDMLIQKLSEYVSVDTIQQDDGSVNVFIGNGQSLVTGTAAARLDVGGGLHDVLDSQIVFTNPSGTSVTVTQNISGGTLGGLLGFRDQILDPAQNALGRIAVGLASEFNNQHALGMDLDGDLGGAFFGDVSTASGLSALSNGGDYLLNSTVTDASKLTNSDYRLNYDGSDYTLIRQSDNTSFGPFAALPVDVSAQEGFTINLTSGTTINAGDSFIIRPARQGAATMSVALATVNDIAVAAPVVVKEATDASGTPVNTGGGAFNSVAIEDSSGLPLGSLSFQYNDATKQFTYVGDVAGTLAYDSTTDSGSSFTVNGISFTITGAPATGDVFSMSPNSSGEGDNRNGLALAGLQSALTLEDGSTSIQGAYSQLIGEVGTKTRQAELSASAQEGMMRIAQQQRDSVSGVNMEEEASDLIRYQQAYEAMAQVISVAETMFQTLISAVRR